MRLTFILNVLFVLSLSANSYSQKDKFTLNLKDVSVKDVIRNIESTSKYRFFYNEELSDISRTVSVNFNQTSLDEILSTLFDKTGIKYMVLENNLIVIAPETNMQQQKITGTITDAGTGESLPGVSILVEGSTTGGISDVNGKYSILVDKADAVLVFSYIGYLPERISVSGKSIIDVKLAADVKQLEEVLVIGYGTINRKVFAGSIASVKAKELKTDGLSNIQQALQGHVAGLNIESGGGSPGSGSRIMIRGIGSIYSPNPIYVVDGVQVGTIDNISPSDIESMDVLKDAAAAAIYGARASNGVVLVTTKGGKKGDLKVTFSSYLGVQSLVKKMDVLNAKEWATVSNAAHDASGKTRLPIAANPDTLGAGTDWQNETYRTAPMQSYNLSLSGGSDNLVYNFTAGYLDQKGIVKLNNYTRYNMRLKSEYTKGRLKIGETVITSRENYRDLGGMGGQGGNAVGAAVKMIPVFKVYDPNAVGGYAGAVGSVVDVANPVAQMNLIEPTRNFDKIFINLYAELELIKGLKYKYNVGSDNTFGINTTYTYPYVVGSLYTNSSSDFYELRDKRTSLEQDHTLTYDKSIGKHNFTILGGFSYEKGTYRFLSGSISGMPGAIKLPSAGSVTPVVKGEETSYSFLSYFGRINYNYDSRYLFSASIRRDGSSRFGKANQFGNFPSVSIGWNISNEDFFKSITTINQLKIRASYGELGNSSMNGSYGGNYRYTPSIDVNDNYVINGSLWTGAIQTSVVNPEIKWEVSKTFDIGFDLSLINSKVALTADYFDKTNSDVLLDVPIPISVGSSAPPTINLGDISNKGIELALSYTDKIGDLNYKLSGTISSYKSIMKKMGTGTQEIFGGNPTHHNGGTERTMENREIGEFFLIKTAGIFNSAEEIQAYTKNGVLIQPNAAPGDIKFVDYNNDGKIGDDDRQPLGSPNPKYIFGFGLNADWKGIDFTIFIQGSQGNKIYNGLRQDLEGMNLEWNYAKTTLNAWTPENHTDFPRAVFNDPNENARVSDRFLEDGSYARIKTLQVGYSLPAKLLLKQKIASLRVYVGFENLYTFTKYKGYNPDLGRASSSIFDRGVDFGHSAYPLPRTSMVGLQVTF